MEWNAEGDKAYCAARAVALRATMSPRLTTVHRAQRRRHLAANKLTLSLTILRHLRDGKTVTTRQLTQAIRDLEALMRRVDRSRSA
jgi:hypothetical protein